MGFFWKSAGTNFFLAKPAPLCHSFAHEWCPNSESEKGHNREHGETYPIGIKTVAAPATVSGERSLLYATGVTAGKVKRMRQKRHEARRPAICFAERKLLILRHTEGADTMNATTQIQSLSISQKLIAGILSLFIGLVLVSGIGFANDVSVHNGAHDTRHATGFPCH